MKVRRTSDRIIAIVLTLGKILIQIICVCGPQSGRPPTEIVCFCYEMASKWDTGSSSQIILFSENFSGYVGKYFVVVQRGNGIGKRNVKGRKLLEFCHEKELCEAKMCL